MQMNQFEPLTVKAVVDMMSTTPDAMTRTIDTAPELRDGRMLVDRTPDERVPNESRKTDDCLALTSVCDRLFDRGGVMQLCKRN